MKIWKSYSHPTKRCSTSILAHFCYSDWKLYDILCKLRKIVQWRLPFFNGRGWCIMQKLIDMPIIARHDIFDVFIPFQILMCRLRLFQNRAVFLWKKPSMWFFFTLYFFFWHNCSFQWHTTLSMRLLKIYYGCQGCKIVLEEIDSFQRILKSFLKLYILLLWHYWDI